MPELEMARAANSPVFGPSAKGFEQSANKCFSGGRHSGPLQSARRRFLYFANFQNLTTKFLAAVLSILPLCQRSVSVVSTQISEPCYESAKATDTFVYSRQWCHS